MFGGVRDDDTSEEGMTSVFFNDMYAYHTTGHGRWTSLMIKTPKKSGGKKAQAKAALPPPLPVSRKFERGLDEYDSENEDAEDDDLSTRTTSVAPPVTSHPANRSVEPDEPVIPLGRYNTMLAVLRNTLYIYGGILERGSREYTLDDFWSIQLDKMDGFNCLRALEVDVTQGGEESSDDDDDDGSDGSGEDEDEDEDEEYDTAESVEEVEEVKEAEEDEAVPAPTKSDLRALANALLDDSKSKERSAAEVISTPLPGETLAVFYARSREHWAQVAHEAGANERGKTLRRNGFALAEEKYESYKPILEEVEKILAEAGLDEDEIKKVGGGGGPGASGESRNRR